MPDFIFTVGMIFAMAADIILICGMFYTAYKHYSEDKAPCFALVDVVLIVTCLINLFCTYTVFKWGAR